MKLSTRSTLRKIQISKVGHLFWIFYFPVFFSFWAATCSHNLSFSSYISSYFAVIWNQWVFWLLLLDILQENILWKSIFRNTYRYCLQLSFNSQTLTKSPAKVKIVRCACLSRWHNCQRYNNSDRTIIDSEREWIPQYNNIFLNKKNHHQHGIQNYLV